MFVKPEEATTVVQTCIPPELMVCCRIGNGKTSAKKSTRPKRKHRAKSRELRAGILYMGCDCEKRNGLQDDCRRTGCQGSPECLTKPDPICGPSEFCDGKHLGKNSYHAAKEEGGGEAADGRITAEYACYPAVLVPNVEKV